MKKSFAALTTVVLALSLLFLIVPDPASSDETARVQRVFDGDTVLLTDGRKVRYLGINTPEWQEPFHLKAKRFNESLVLGKEVRLEFDDEREDTYGRLLAYLYVGDEMVNAKLVEEGLAHVFFFPSNKKHKALLMKLQGKARDRNAGIWSRRDKMSVLKITSVHPMRHTGGAVTDPYVRITNISNKRLVLSGYTLSAETGPAFMFPAVALEPGYTVLVVSGKGIDGINNKGQLIVYWSGQPAVWNAEENTAYLSAPDGTLIDTFHYKERRGDRKSNPKKTRRDNRRNYPAQFLLQ